MLFLLSVVRLSMMIIAKVNEASRSKPFCAAKQEVIPAITPDMTR
jgi:hypothetical protein